VGRAEVSLPMRSASKRIAHLELASTAKPGTQESYERRIVTIQCRSHYLRVRWYHSLAYALMERVCDFDGVGDLSGRADDGSGASFEFETIRQRKGRWVLADLGAKSGASAPSPSRSQQGIHVWIVALGVVLLVWVRISAMSARFVD
jgi:hypothetical protein